MSYVLVPLEDAIRIAKLERDSLAVRASEGGRCAPLWRKAAKEADKAVKALERKDTKVAVRAMYGVAKGWHRAARCRGFRLPGRLLARKFARSAR